MTASPGFERALPEHVDSDLFDALVIRTDFSDNASWNAVLDELRRPWGPEGEFPASVQVVDAPPWSGASADEVLAAVDECWSVVFIADRITMQSPLRALLALSTGWEDVGTLDPVYYQELIESPEPREFRTMPAAVHGIHTDLVLGNVNFAEYAEAAGEEPGRVLRPL
ncbi:hypothetical protein [Streptomyces sp. NBC_01789]|uniref:DUF6924 domain-containing protein n=1 Tax=Streptomyces sp. NBC_01789 TaxID=2975941 RepID=UPI00224D45A4|nr:hypothetical protein [Streptomyces sp. NBC_01789]MCX4451579.1 hypothetical protein [Streptomyces sp. NBC_01789]